MYTATRKFRLKKRFEATKYVSKPQSLLNEITELLQIKLESNILDDFTISTKQSDDNDDIQYSEIYIKLTKQYGFCIYIGYNSFDNSIDASCYIVYNDNNQSKEYQLGEYPIKNINTISTVNDIFDNFTNINVPISELISH